jgi:hypothetical protein
VNKKMKKTMCVKLLELDEVENYFQEISFMDKLSSPFIVSLDSNLEKI